MSAVFHVLRDYEILITVVDESSVQTFKTWGKELVSGNINETDQMVCPSFQLCVLKPEALGSTLWPLFALKLIALTCHLCLYTFYQGQV